MQIGTSLRRIHRAARSPWHFSADGSGRFDLCDSPGRGTCYLAERLLGSFVEVFRNPGIVTPKMLAVRRENELIVWRDLRLADCTSGLASPFGISAAVHSTENYKLTQSWATAFDEAGFDGVRYLVSHDPRQQLVGVALFGMSSTHPGRPQAIPQWVLDQAERTFGIVVRPTGP